MAAWLARLPLTFGVARPRHLSPVRAVQLIAAFTLVATLVSGALIHLVDRSDFPTLGSGLWWAAQTVTTVGYGDEIPKHTIGRVVGVWVMLAGIAAVAIATAAVSASLIDEARQRHVQSHDSLLADRLDELSTRLARIEAALQEQRAR